VGLGVGLNAVAMREIPSLPLPGTEPRSSASSLVTILTELHVSK